MCTHLLGLLALVFATAQPPDMDPARIAGWYDAPAGHRLLVTWGAKGGYRLLDFEEARFHSLEPFGSGEFRVAGDGAWKGAAMTVTRDSRDRAAMLRMRLAGGESLSFPRARQYPFDVEEVRFSRGAVTLGGILLAPRVSKLVGRTGGRLRPVPIKLPAVVVLHGSGSSDRDNIWAFTFAQSLARAGVVTLFPDKRGSGASGGDWRRSGLEALAEDAVAAVALLRKDSRVDTERIGLLGLSQGGLVAPLAAARSGNVAFVASVSAAPIPLVEQMRHEMEQDLRRAGVPPAGIEQVVRVGQLAMAHARSRTDESWNAYDVALRGLREGPLSPAAASFPASLDDWRWTWWPLVIDIDPLPAWSRFKGPRLAVFGEDDEQDNVPVRRSVTRLSEVFRPGPASPDVVRVFASRGHTLTDPARGWVDRTVLAFINEWVLSAVGGLDGGLQPPKAQGVAAGARQGARGRTTADLDRWDR